jgi:hypothetical protein
VVVRFLPGSSFVLLFAFSRNRSSFAQLASRGRPTWLPLLTR